MQWAPRTPTFSRKVLVGFAALRIISGIFMAETLRVANNNDTIMVMQKKRKQFETRQKMTKLFKAAEIKHSLWAISI